MTLFAISGIGIVTALAVTAVKEHSRSLSLAAALCGGVIILFFCLSPIKEIYENLSSLISAANIDTSYIKILLKSLGICLIGEFAADTHVMISDWRDCREKSSFLPKQQSLYALCRCLTVLYRWCLALLNKAQHKQIIANKTFM